MKISLSKQLIFIFVIVLLITTILFNIILSSWLTEIYSDLNYSRLDDYAHATKVLVESDIHDTDDSTLDYVDNETVDYIITDLSNMNKLYYPTRMLDSMRYADLTAIVNNCVIWAQTDSDYHAKISTSTTDIFVSASLTEDGDYLVIALSTGEYIDTMKQQATMQIMIVFILILVFGGCIIGAWSNMVVNRIDNIRNHVAIMPTKNYNDPYLDHGVDEISELSISIESMRQEISKNEITKQDILQNVSHDLKTPIAVIKSYAEAIGDNVESIDSTQIIIQQANVLQNKVEKLLQLNRLEYLENNEQYEMISMAGLITTMVDNLKYLSELNFITDLDNTCFNGYYENIYTVVENILSNALRFARKEIKITLRAGTLIIYNDGEHIDENFLDANFKAYEKGSKGLFGLGMSIAKKTLTFFNLTLAVENEKVGVSFIITDPNYSIYKNTK